MAYSRIKKLANYLRPHWQIVTGGVVALLIVNLLGVYIPLLIRDSIDDLSKSFDFQKIHLLSDFNCRFSLDYVVYPHDFQSIVIRDRSSGRVRA